jgi:hypothetical protein
MSFAKRVLIARRALGGRVSRCRRCLARALGSQIEEPTGLSTLLAGDRLASAHLVSAIRKGAAGLVVRVRLPRAREVTLELGGNALAPCGALGLGCLSRRDSPLLGRGAAITVASGSTEHECKS